MTKLNAGKASVLVLTAALAVGAVLFGKSLTSVFASSQDKIRICHAKPADTAANGWVSINVSEKAIVTGTSKHATEHNADIIPFFTFDFSGGGTYAGKNWDATGQAVWDNNCKALTPTPIPSPTPTINPCIDRVCESPSPLPTPTPFDACPNLDGNQGSVPDGYDVDNNDNCVPEPVDVCPNLDGFQGTIPDTYHKDPGTIDCIQYQLGGAPPPSGGAGGGQVLGASTMAKTGGFEENLYLAIMSMGGLFTFKGFKGVKKAFKKA